ncbi:MAG: aspartate 1-decarboxylase [Acidimicrobiales bacterium]
MRRRMMKSKIHRATVTGADLHYVGSITLDPELLEGADIAEYEQVHVLDIDNGARFETYAITGVRGSGDCCLNGAAARLVSAGDKIIVITYGDYTEAELADYEPLVVHVDSANHPVDERTAKEFAGLDRPAPRRYVEVEADPLPAFAPALAER